VASTHFFFPWAGPCTPAFLLTISLPLSAKAHASGAPHAPLFGQPPRCPRATRLGHCRSGRRLPIRTKPTLPRLMPPCVTPRHPPFPFPATARPPPIKRAEHCWRPAPPLRSLVHARAHPLPPSPVTPTTALRHRSHPLFDEITVECYRPPLSGEHPLRALVSQISATLTFSVLSRSC
jgi:hypothetical protein